MCPIFHLRLKCVSKYSNPFSNVFSNRTKSINEKKKRRENQYFRYAAVGERIAHGRGRFALPSTTNYEPRRNGKRRRRAGFLLSNRVRSLSARCEIERAVALLLSGGGDAGENRGIRGIWRGRARVV